MDDGAAAMAAVAAAAAAKAAHVAGHAGSNLGDVVATLLPAVAASIVLHRLALLAASRHTGSSLGRWVFAAEAAALVLPIVALLPLEPQWVPQYPVVVSAWAMAAASVSFLAVFNPAAAAPAPAPPSSSSDRRPPSPQRAGGGGGDKGAPARAERIVDAFRGLTVLLTCYAILAVDFEFFPRRHAKTEDVGVSLMDLGSGSVVLSAGVVAGRPRRMAGPGGRSRLATVLTLVALGATRLVAVAGAGYAVHVTEYGVHWNFFWTLAVVLTLHHVVVVWASSSGVHATAGRLALLAVSVAAAHQAALWAGLERAVATAPREGLISANKEGLASVPGYCALFAAGAAVGATVFAGEHGRDAGAERSSSPLWPHRPTRAPVAQLLFAPTCASWAVCLASAARGLRVSRKLANGHYVVFVVAVNLLMMYTIAWLDQVLPSAGPAAQRRPDVLHRVSRHQLAVFVAANLATGGVNLLVDTLAVRGDVAAAGVLPAYMLAVCAVPLLFSTNAGDGAFEKRAKIRKSLSASSYMNVRVGSTDNAK